MKSDMEEEAAEVYDLAAIELRGVHAVTNFEISNYCEGSTKRLEEPCKLELQNPCTGPNLTGEKV